ncbi:MAG TPA: tetratricopeptide repeat protein, partial [Rudaea sp.]|nr:tetratricopeptide repeat protein [Rudaea sp.]
NKLDRAVEAESLYRDVYQARREVLGAQHYATLISLNNLAVQLRRLGQFAQSEPLQRQAYEGLQKTIGVHDPRSVQTGLNVVQDLIPQGKFEAAQHLLESLLGDVRQHGKQQVVALALRLFGQSLQGQGKLDAAEQSYEQSWQAAKAIKNTDEQRETAQAAANLHDKAGAGAAKSTIWQQRLQELSSRPGETPKPAKADS